MSVRPLAVNENVHNVNHMVCVDHILHTYACQHYLTSGIIYRRF